jgi:hypothetical protein
MSEIPDRDVNVPVELLIGANCAKALEPQCVVPSVNGVPYAVKTALGWCVSGPTDPEFDQLAAGCHVDCHRILTVEDSKVKDMIVQMYNNDFNESMSQPLCSVSPSVEKSHSNGDAIAKVCKNQMMS